MSAGLIFTFRIVRRAFVCALLATAGPRVALAADLRAVLEGYSLASWDRRDGLPTTHVRALAQDTDGYLWVGTDAGLLRFDGLRFVPWETLSDVPLPSRAVRMLFAAADGSLWVGSGEPGGLTRIRKGEVRTYGEAEGLPAARVFVDSMAEDPGGAIWVGRSDGLYRFANDRWERWTPGHGIGPGAVVSTHVDADGRLLIGMRGGAYRLRKDTGEFEQIGDSDAPLRSIATDRFGRIWVSDPVTGIRPASDAPGSSAHAERGVGGVILTDRNGFLWLATVQGVWRIQPTEGTVAPAIHKATAATGLLADGVTSLLEDRDGNIWVGTVDGLNRLTPHKVKSRTDLGFASAIEHTRSGIWVGSADELIRFPAATPESTPARYRFAGTISSIHADPDGVLWVATTAGLYRVVATRVRLEISRVLPQNRLALIASGRDGLWLGDLDAGLLQLTRGRVGSGPEVPRPLQAALGASDGTLWLAAADGAVATVAPDGQVRVVPAQDGLLSSGYTVIHQSSDGVVWLGGPDGLTRYANGRFSTLRRSDNFPLQSFRAFAEDDAGNMWIGTEAGIYCMARAELDRAFGDAQYAPKYRLYDLTDGLAGFPLAVPGNRRAVRAGDGRLWFVTHRGVTVLDPREHGRGRSHAPVYVEGITVGDRRFRPSSAPLVLPPRTSRLQIEYGTLNLTSPLKTRFRYRLEGFDADWNAAGLRWQAVYTNLPPKRYRFVVQADNNEGSWGPPATLEFSVAPVFYQTWSFAIGSLAAAGLAVGVAWRMRLRRVRKEFAIILAERVRLSREIHDTLLQSLVGIALQCDAIASDIDRAGDTAKLRLVRMRKQVEDYIREARQSIWDLRSPKLQGHDLTEALRDVVDRVSADTDAQIEFRVTGQPHRGPAKVEEQLLRIAQEALQNAVRHARATHVVLELTYDGSRVGLRVTDDGVGFDPARAGAGGHYGLTTMRERAAELGAMLRVDSREGHGTRVETDVRLGAGA